MNHTQELSLNYTKVPALQYFKMMEQKLVSQELIGA